MKFFALLIAAATGALATPVLSADLVAPTSNMPTNIATPGTATWDGPYLGASVGYGWGFTNDTGGDANLSGLFVGGQAGYSFHLTDQLVAGVEGDLNWSNERGTFPITTTFRINWDGSVRGRLGVDLGGVLPYAEAGLAFADATYSNVTDYEATHVGWTAGAGVEFALGSNVSANVEYRYADYGSQSHKSISFPLTDSTVRVGVNYHF